MRYKPLMAIFLCLILVGSSAYILTSNIGSDSNVDEESQPADNDNYSAFGNITSFNDAVNGFAFNFFDELYNNSDDSSNIFYSPYSVFVAMAMTYEGAKGDTADEMAEVLTIEQDNASFHEYMKALYDYLNKQSDYNISTANALWVKENLELLEEYQNIIETYYNGKATDVNFDNRTKAVNIINQWIENHTNGLIKDLIKEYHITPLTALILTNAIYFKGMWKVQFDPANTTDRDFQISSDNTIPVSTMSLVNTEDKFNYTETEKLQMLELPYSGDEISMLVLLPKEGYDLTEIIKIMDSNTLSELKNSMNEKMVDIYLPKFTIETEYSLKDYLQNLGMIKSFTNYADFSGMTGRKDLCIDEVLHKAFIEVNEEGTEAAAATAVIMRLTSVNGNEDDRIVFDVDHPFLFLIQHKETDTILFMGSITNP